MNGMRLAWAVSGRGATLRAVIAASARGLLNSRVALVVADRESPVESVCNDYKLAFRLLVPNEKSPWIQLQEQLRRQILDEKIDWLFLTFNRLINETVINAVGGCAANLHLSMLPAFRGFGATRKALASGVRFTGATVHLIDSGVDAGPILAQAVCPVFDGDTEASLGRRQFEASVQIILQTIRSIERNEVQLNASRQPIWHGPSREGGALQFPVVDEDLIEFSRKFCATV
jgi:phosphoribosylglycinamide formyltransferase 1